MEKSRIVLLREFFGIKHGQSLKEFMDAEAICQQTGNTIKYT